MAISSAAILRGDDYSRNGEYRRAWEQYQQVNPAALDDRERHALIVRKASVLLALDQASAALQTVSDFYRGRGVQIDQVEVTPALIFAYSYGRMNDYDQSLAWFLRAHQAAKAERLRSDQASQGVRLLLASLNDQQIDQVDRTWTNDPYINSLLGAERARRARNSGFQL
ncbi:MAG: hypothetical protein KDD42_07075, partial [Bdellovibrionales bacterium]|nr:hypothetical protein [Bdellovibrionales bacterium]